MNLSPPDNRTIEPISLSDPAFAQLPSAPISVAASSSDTDKGATATDADFEPSYYDVLCGRGKGCAAWVGNRRFRVTIQMNKERYIEAPTKLDKSLVVDEIVKTISSASPNGGFVKKDPTTEKWYTISHKEARDKVGHAMRDAVSEKKNKRQRKKRRSVHKGKAAPVPTMTSSSALVPVAATSSPEVIPQPIKVSNIRNSIRASIQGSFIRDADFAAFLLEALGGNARDEDESVSLLSETALFHSLQDTKAVEI